MCVGVGRAILLWWFEGGGQNLRGAKGSGELFLRDQGGGAGQKIKKKGD